LNQDVVVYSEDAKQLAYEEFLLANHVIRTAFIRNKKIKKNLQK